MRSGGSSDKGGKFERWACRRFSLWVSGGARDDLFWRTASSGGRATFLHRTRGILSPGQAGDMTAISAEGYPLAARVLLEFKHYADLGIAQGLVKDTGNLHRFWERTCVDARTYGKQPVLVARQNLYPTLAVVSRDAAVFAGDPHLVVPRWDAELYLFEDATHVERPRATRRRAA